MNQVSGIFTSKQREVASFLLLWNRPSHPVSTAANPCPRKGCSGWGWLVLHRPAGRGCACWSSLWRMARSSPKAD